MCKNKSQQTNGSLQRQGSLALPAFKTLLFALFSVSSVVLAAQAPEDVLRTVWEDPRLTAHDDAVKMVTDANTLNPLQKADIRLDRGELNQDDVQIGLRLYPKGYSEHRTTRELQRVLERNERAAKNEMLSRLLSSKYNLLARMALLREKKQLADELGLVLRRANQAVAYSAGRDRTELKSLLKNKNDIEKMDFKVADVERDYRSLQAELKEMKLPPAEAFDLNDLMNMDDIRQRLETFKPIETQSNLTGQVADLDLAVTRAEIDYEKAKDQKWLEHIEVSMKEDIKAKERVYGLEVAINLPFTQATDLSTVSKLTRELRDKAKAMDTGLETRRLVENANVELRTLLDLHRALSVSQKRMSSDQMRKASKAISAQDPMLAVELQKGWFEARESVLDLEFRIRALFIVFLHETSVIASSPQLNQLSKTTRKIL